MQKGKNKIKIKIKIKQKNKAQKKLGFRDTSTKSPRLCQYLYTMRRGRQKGRKTERLPLEAETKAKIVEQKLNCEKQKVGKGKDLNLKW